MTESYFLGEILNNGGLIKVDDAMLAIVHECLQFLDFVMDGVGI